MTLRGHGAWLGVIVGAIGWALTLLSLARGGGYLVVVPRLAFVLPLAVVSTVAALAVFGVGRRIMTSRLWLLVVVLYGVFWNFLIYWVRFGDGTWGLLVPLAKPIGLDFRDGLYEPATAFSTLHSGWPPLTLLLGRLFTVFDFSTGYALQVAVLVALALAATGFSAVLAVRALGEHARPVASDDATGDTKTGLLSKAPVLIGIVSGIWLLTSYGFMYEIERGNIDLYVLFFSLLSVWLMLKASRSPWWPALALAVAINLKLYPGVLLVLLFWHYRWRAVVPAVVTNVVLLLIAGPGNVLHTLSGQGTLQSNERALWWGNHSAAAFANVLDQLYGWPEGFVTGVLLGVALALWAVTLVLLVRRGWTARTVVLAAASCVPVMSVVPAISHDYKLVLYVFPLAVLAAFVPAMTRRDPLVWSLAFGLLAWAMLQLSRSSLVIAPALLTSKFVMILLVQCLLLFVVWRTGQEPAAFGDGLVDGASVEAAETVPAAKAKAAAGGSAGSRLLAWLKAAVGGAEERPAQTGPEAAGSLAWPTRKTVCIVLLLLAAVLGANFWVGIVGNTFNDLNSGIGVPQHDFFQYYAGGHNWELGVDPYLNHPDDQRVIDQPRHDRSDISGYIYPPTLLPLFGALTHTDYDTARAVWLALNVSAFALLILVAVMVSRGRRLEVLTAAVLLTMVSFAFFYHVHEGQIDMIVAALSVSAFLLYPRWKGWPSAALLAVAIAVKVSPVLLVAVIALYYRDWRFVLKVLACGVVVFAASLLVVDVSLYREYVGRILPRITGSDPSQYNQTPLRFWWKYPTAVRIGSALGYAALLFLAWVSGKNSRRLPETERRVDLRTERNSVLLLSVVLMLLFSPLAWQMAYVWAIVPLALVLTAAPPRGKEWAVLVLAAGAALLSMRMWPYRVLDMTNIIGAAVTALCVMLYYLPLDLDGRVRGGEVARVAVGEEDGRAVRVTVGEAGPEGGEDRPAASAG